MDTNTATKQTTDMDKREQYQALYPEPATFYRFRQEPQPPRRSDAPVLAGFYLRCGSWWLAITPGFGCEWVTYCGFGKPVPESNCYRMLSREEAEYWKVRLEARVHASTYEIVEVQG